MILEAVKNANLIGHSDQGGDFGQTAIRHGSDNLPGMQPDAKEQVGPMPERHIHVGRRGLEVLALPVSGGRIL